MMLLIKWTYFALVFGLIYLTVFIPLLLVTFNPDKTTDLFFGMIDKLDDFMDLQPKWEFIAVFKGKVGIS